MTRLKSIPMAIGGLVLMAGTVAAFTALPDAAAPGLQKATEASGKKVPVRAVPVDAPAVDTPAVAPDVAPEEVPSVDVPNAVSHGDAVSAVATAEDSTPDTNHGADVSAIARDNHGQATAAEHRPADAGKPDGVGKREGVGKPDGAGKPE